MNRDEFEDSPLGDDVDALFRSSARIRSDEHILRDILESLAENEEIRTGEIDIVVRDGQVTLTGSVADRKTRKAAEVSVAKVTGVSEITNQLRIDFSPESQDRERQEP